MILILYVLLGIFKYKWINTANENKKVFPQKLETGHW